MDISTNILDLPDEMMIKILKEINLSKLIKCRLVSRRFKFLIDNMDRKKLIFFNDFFFARVGFNLIGMDPQFDHKNSIRLPKSLNDFFKISLFKGMIKSVKELKFLAPDFQCIKYFYNFDMQILNEFLNLEKLYLINFNNYSPNYINMPNLKDLKIGFDIIPAHHVSDIWENLPFYFDIKSNIKRLALMPLNNKFSFYIKYPESVIYLELRQFFQMFDFRRFNFAQFTNLKILRLVYSCIPTKKELRLTTKLKLEKLYFEFEIGIYKHLDKYPEYRGIFDILDELIELKRQKKVEIKHIYLNNIELTKPIQNHNFHLCDIILEAQLLNYESFTNHSYTKNVFEYDKFIEFLESNQGLFDFMEKDEKIPDLPIDFFTKFDIRFVSICSLKDSDHNYLIRFLSKCKCINALCITELNLSQLLIDQLPICGQTLSKLSLRSVNNKKECEKINFDSLFGFKYLFILKLMIELDNELVLKLFKNCKKLQHLKFFLSNKIIGLQKHFSKTIIKNVEDLNVFQEFINLYSFPNWKSYYSKSSLKYIEENFEYKTLFVVTCFNKNISVAGLNYNQLDEYLKKIPQLVENELKLGKKDKYVSKI